MVDINFKRHCFFFTESKPVFVKIDTQSLSFFSWSFLYSTSSFVFSLPFNISLSSALRLQQYGPQPRPTIPNSWRSFCSFFWCCLLFQGLEVSWQKWSRLDVFIRSFGTGLNLSEICSEPFRTVPMCQIPMSTHMSHMSTIKHNETTAFCSNASTCIQTKHKTWLIRRNNTCDASQHRAYMF